ncbi:hypothetical protein BO94DRAFT_590345 [Aspergillus sclerotioniger CBS 115572]|uniref:Uncharacterized protein n=1 Tax=Aspergillus sclerotioniger CBS 115572 TaxID=1450535 RepID=A0A317V6W3_9EURO|nr:hypothetical protein BO94DRAFT_590345 [Aspergillus sclerotioniger CBS 115572]PWY69836.1 hypothetical protein BO94DRAFT_590345 [Aspergillus sclerotioniger CBS 115572]
MSQDPDSQLSQGFLAPPAEITGPATPMLRASLSASPDLSVGAESQASHSDQSRSVSSPSLPSSDMTPPPSSQIPGAPRRRSRSCSSSLLASPPDIEKTLCVAYGASENLPTADDIDTADESKLRTIAKDLLGVAQEARMSALHFKLQNSLLSFTSNEAIKRAEVEHKLARREVEIIQSSEYRSRHCQPEIRKVQQISNVELELALKRNQELERVNTTLDRRLRRAKKLIEQERERSELLKEENNLLKGRIRDNRKHFSQMIEHCPMSPSPQAEVQVSHRRTLPQFADHNGHQMNGNDSHNPFAALLAADRVLNHESPSVTSTPHRPRTYKQHNDSHMRGSHSLSTLPLTPSRARMAHEGNQYNTPGRESHDGHRDRDSTISASDIEEAENEEDIPASEAGALASSMLRSHTFSNRRESRGPASAPKSSTLLQTKLFGQVKKAGVERPLNGLKRKASFDGATPKKAKAEERVGLGIDTWNK